MKAISFMKAISLFLALSFLFNLLSFDLVLAQEGEKLIVAVVDFTNIKKDPALDYLVKGIPESIITYLGKSGKLEIVERSRLEAALREMQLTMSGIVDEQTAVEVGKAVGANAIMVGSFLQIGNLIRINTRLIDVKTSRVIAAEQVQGTPGEEIFTLMDRTAAAFESVLGLDPEDTPSGIHLERCRAFERKPPEDGWDWSWDVGVK